MYISVCMYIYTYVCTYKCISLQHKMSQRCTSWFERSVVLRACTWLPSRSLHTQFLSCHGSCLSSHSLKICWPPVSHSPQVSSSNSSRTSSDSSLRRSEYLKVSRSKMLPGRMLYSLSLRLFSMSVSSAKISRCSAGGMSAMAQSMACRPSIVVLSSTSSVMVLSREVFTKICIASSWPLLHVVLLSWRCAATEGTQS